MTSCYIMINVHILYMLVISYHIGLIDDDDDDDDDVQKN